MTLRTLTLLGIGSIASFLLAPISSRAQTPDADLLLKLQQRIESLEQRLSEQESRNRDLEAQVQALQKASPTAAAQAPPAPSLQQAPQPKEAPATFPVTSSAKVQLYGFLKLDAAYETSATYPGDYMLWVKPYPANGQRQPEFHETANQSRFGLNFSLPAGGQINTRGKMEIDFYGGGPENKANPMMRHAYMEFEWPAYRFTLLAGQTSDVISPLTPPTLYYSVAWFQGNIGYRHPQIRLTKAIPTGEGSGWNLQLALVRPMGRDLADRRTGPDSAHPDLQGRVACSFPGAAGQSVTLGISGHWGQETYRAFAASEKSVTVDSGSINLDLTIPLGKRVAITGEGFSGKDLDAFLGGSSQPVNFTKGYATASAGGWLALTLKPSPAWTFNLGAGLDDPRNSDLSAGARSRNRIAFGNFLWGFTKSALMGFELSYMDTQYLGQQNAHAVRGQLAFQYNF